MTRDQLLRMSNRDLLQVLRDGYAIRPEALDDTGYRGIALGLPRFVEKLTWKTFQKTFHRDPKTGVLRGWNVRAEQRGLDAPTVAKQKNGRACTFGHYQVVPTTKIAPRIGLSRGLLIDYGLGNNGFFDPMRFMRDPLVAVNVDQVDLLLGWSYVELGFVSFGTPSFFTLEREGPLVDLVPARGW
jgi:hypothetical protein